jgi:hypothetical protein
MNVIYFKFHKATGIQGWLEHMTARSLASSRYGKHYTRDRERSRSRVSMIHGTTNFENSDDVQYEKHNEISNTHNIYR